MLEFCTYRKVFCTALNDIFVASKLTGAEWAQLLHIDVETIPLWIIGAVFPDANVLLAIYNHARSMHQSEQLRLAIVEFEARLDEPVPPDPSGKFQLPPGVTTMSDWLLYKDMMIARELALQMPFENRRQMVRTMIEHGIELFNRELDLAADCGCGVRFGTAQHSHFSTCLFRRSATKLLKA